MATAKTKKKVVKKVNKRKCLEFNKYSIWFQSFSMIFAIAGLALNICNCIDMNIMLDFFGLSVVLLAFSLFPKKEN